MSRRSKLRHSEGAELAWLSGPIAGTSGRAFPAESRWDSQRGALAICIFLALAIWVVFGQTLYYGFVNYDDGVCVYDNPATPGG